MKKVEILSVGYVRAGLTKNTVSLHCLYTHKEKAKRNNKKDYLFKMVFGRVTV